MTASRGTTGAFILSALVFLGIFKGAPWRMLIVMYFQLTGQSVTATTAINLTSVGNPICNRSKRPTSNVTDFSFGPEGMDDGLGCPDVAVGT